MTLRKEGAHSAARSAGRSAVGSLIALGALIHGPALRAQTPFFTPGNLVVSRSVYGNRANAVSVGTTLPPNCNTTCGRAIANGTYPFVWNNDLVDGSFGVTSKILLDQITPAGTLVNTFEVPNNSAPGMGPNQMVTSFPSKSELALNLSTDGNFLTFMGYVAGVNALDVSNTNTPKVGDPTNPVRQSYYRAVATLDAFGAISFTVSNAYSGNNGRAAILNNTDGANVIYTAGNAGNGADPQPVGILLGAGAQIMTPSTLGEFAQGTGLPTPLASFNITELGAPHDKLGKDDNFRGLTIFNNVVYYTKGSGGNGVNTVYFVDATGGACSSGHGVPSTLATLPTTPLAFDPSVIATSGLQPSNMCILEGFPTALNSSLKKKTTAYPFGLWFANATTLYVADEGDGVIGDLLPTTGLQKWVFTGGKWNRVYTMQTGLGLGSTYSFPGDAAYPKGINPATGVDWAPITGGLRNITGRVNDDGTVTIWAVTATVSGNGDQGADPNKLVVITDVLANTSAAVGASETFVTLKTAGYGEVLRGVSLTPGHVVLPPANQ